MNGNFFKRFKNSREVDPDEIFLDSSNIPNYDTSQFEGRLERPISRFTLYSVLTFFILIALIFAGQAATMQVIKGREYKERSLNNLLRPVPIFAGRGAISDRNGQVLAWNSPSRTVSVGANSDDDNVAVRQYATTTGLGHILGYVQYPSKDANGFYYQEDFVGITGAEKYFDQRLQGTSGSRLVEVDARGQVVSGNIVRPPIQGENIQLAIDSRVQSALYHDIKDIATRVGFAGGSGVIMDVTNGEVIALTNYPEFNSQVMSDKTDKALVRAELNNPGLPFLNRAIDGLYTPGSIVKPFIALGVLNEGIISPEKIIVTTGSISIPNPYDATKATLFRDWKNHGSLNMRQAIAVSSDAYFYTVGGGYQGQKGLGIVNIDKYLKIFGFGTTTLDNSQSLLVNKAGTIPTPEWKKKTFNEAWFVGDTYHTAIGQYGFQVTPIQIVRAVAALANDGLILTPHLQKGEPLHAESAIEIPDEYFKVIHEGMRLSVTYGTSVALNVPYVKIAAKSGTAELGLSKDKVNSWITGYWPYENPKYAFVVTLEKGSVHNLIGAAASMRQTFDWMNENTPEYFR